MKKIILGLGLALGSVWGSAYFLSTLGDGTWMKMPLFFTTVILISLGLIVVAMGISEL